MNLPTPGSFAGLENREEAIAKPCTNSPLYVSHGDGKP